jgi:hypothetical protein
MATLPNNLLANKTAISATEILRSSAIAGDPRIDSAIRLDQIEVGKNFKAQILSFQPDGTAVVQLTSKETGKNSATVQMQLPAGLEVGESLELTLLGKSPNLSFGVSGRLLNPEQKFSSLGQMMGQIPNDSTPIKGARPLLRSSLSHPESVDDLPPQLSKAVEMSGTFYESHLKDWLIGQRTTDQIKQEPQNQLNLMRAVIFTDTEEDGTGGTNNSVIPQQLNALEKRSFTWQGELWPGQHFTWQIKDDTPRTPNKSNEPIEKVWQTRMQFHLPHLGEVKASVIIVGNQTQVKLLIDKEAGIARLQESQQAFIKTLSALGHDVSSIVIQKDE